MKEFGKLSLSPSAIECNFTNCMATYIATILVQLVSLYLYIADSITGKGHILPLWGCAEALEKS